MQQVQEVVEHSEEEEKERDKHREDIFTRFTDMINVVLDVFEKQPIVESSKGDEIEKKYPKFLSKYKLINLQFNDFHFRESFMIQVLILLQSLRQPINIIQKKYFKIPDKKLYSKLRNRIYKILINDTGSEKLEDKGIVYFNASV